MVSVCDRHAAGTKTDPEPIANGVVAHFCWGTGGRRLARWRQNAAVPERPEKLLLRIWRATAQQVKAILEPGLKTRRVSGFACRADLPSKLRAANRGRPS